MFIHVTCGDQLTGTHRDLQSQLYEIRIRGHLGETIRSAFPSLQVRALGDSTVLTGMLADQAALYGVLAAAEALGLELIEVRRLRTDGEGGHGVLPTDERPVLRAELSHPPRSWAERTYHVTRYTIMPRSGHFAAHEEPALRAAGLTEFFRPLR
jgi:hypothetical protein